MTGYDVVIVARDHGATLAATLGGLAAQSHPPASVVLVLNACRDESARIATRFAAQLPLEVIESAENTGFSAAANLGIGRGAAAWVLSLNPDCRLAPAFCATLLTAAEREAQTGAACGLLLRAEGETLDATGLVDSAGMVVTVSGRHHDRGAGQALRDAWRRPAWVFGASGAAALYRRAALADVAYRDGEVFDERFFAYREDADLAWRLQRRGWRCRYEPAAIGFHARGLKPEEARRGTPEINRYSVRNRFLLRWSNADWRWRAACFPAWLLRDLAVVAACLTVERSSLPALAEARRLRRAQLARGRANAARARVSGWRIASWFLPGRRVREVV